MSRSRSGAGGCVSLSPPDQQDANLILDLYNGSAEKTGWTVWEDLAESLGPHDRTIREGRLRGRKLGKRWYVTLERLKAYFRDTKAWYEEAERQARFMSCLAEIVHFFLGDIVIAIMAGIRTSIRDVWWRIRPPKEAGCGN